MNTKELETFIHNRLHLEEFASSDISLNGLQVGSPVKEIKKVVCAVDASLETFKRAHEEGADAIFVHHGLFWGKSIAITDSHYKRVAFLITHDISLFAAHLPLDAHPALGNNGVMARLLSLEDITPFGSYHGLDIGYKGVSKKGLTIDEITNLLGFSPEKGLNVLPFGKEKIHKVAIVSGGASREVLQAISIGCDAYITGEASHEMYNICKEEGITMICGGHYQSEVFGVQAFGKALKDECKLEAIFVDIPTAL
ncbi:MAG: Nif3-like dinuclear metal center hexameric protein [Spirochaetia bacterium]|nr:Nif3-like dinuclear metal center hexameric protein [Spirochaetia bacterium]